VTWRNEVSTTTR